MSEQNKRDQIVETHETNEVPRGNEHDTKLGFSMLAKVTLGVVVITSLIICISCLMQFNQNRQDIADLREDLKKRNDYIREMQDILNSDMDDEYIIRQAKERLGYYFPDEEIFYQDVND